MYKEERERKKRKKTVARISTGRKNSIVVYLGEAFDWWE